MPKKNLKSTGHEDESERRPQQITLACFMKPAKPRAHNQAEKESDSPEHRQTRHAVGATLSTHATTDGSDEIPFDGAGQRDVRQSSHSMDGCNKDFSAECETEREVEGFKVMRTKKGGFPIYVEKRAKGKKVTVVRQVTGNSKLLLQTLKSKFGTGGLIKPGEVEIQGDFEDKLIKYFKENTQLLVQYSSKS